MMLPEFTTMVAQYTTSPSPIPSSKAPTAPPSKENASSSSTKTKRTRTKHACDECRRTQKKCDGAKPTCRRCLLNDTPCTYTPHKARRSCACIGPHDVRRHRPLPGVCIFPSEHCVGYEYPSVVFSQNERDRIHSRVSAYQVPTVPSQRPMERRRMLSRQSYSDSRLHSSSQSTIAYPRIIPSPTQLSDSDTLITLPSPASTLVDITAVREPDSPFLVSSASLLSMDEKYLRTSSLMPVSLHAGSPPCEASFQDNNHAEPSYMGSAAPLYLANATLEEHAFQFYNEQARGLQHGPDASYHLGFTAPSSYFTYSSDHRTLESYSPQMIASTADIIRLPEEKQIHHSGRHSIFTDDYTEPHFSTSARLAQEANCHSPFTSNDHSSPYASPTHANWQRDSLASHCHTAPGADFSGIIYQQYEAYAGSH